MFKLYIKDIKQFINIITSINKAVDGCEFILSPEGLSIDYKDECGFVRSYLTSNCVCGSDIFSFCLLELNKFKQVLTTINMYEPKNEYEIDFDGSVLKYKGRGKFSLACIDSNVISRYKTPKLKVDINDTYGFTTNYTLISKLLGISSICTSEKPNVYLSKTEHDEINAEINDKSISKCDTISLPISESVYGNWDSCMVLTLESMRSINLFNTNSININMTDRKVVHVHILVENDEYFIKMDSYISQVGD